MSGPEERERVVDLYFTMPMTAAQVAGHLGCPTRRSSERRPAADPRYAGHMAKPIIPLETRRRAVGLVPGGMRRKQAARGLGVRIGAVRNRSRGNAVMREVVEVAGKDPGVGLRRLSDREGPLPAGRLRPACSPGSVTCLPGIAPGGRLLPSRRARG